MQGIMKSLRDKPLSKIASMEVVKIDDYLKSETKDIKLNSIKEIKLPKSNVISYSLEGGSEVIVRPSGTEPKIKLYVTSVEKDFDSANKQACKIINDMEKTLNL